MDLNAKHNVANFGINVLLPNLVHPLISER